jgi:hypothetical protein
VKLEYPPQGSPECPLIRLYDFDQPQAKQLSELVKSLAAGDRENVALHNEAWVESVGECCLNLQSGKRNQGVRTTPPILLVSSGSPTKARLLFSSLRAANGDMGSKSAAATLAENAHPVKR